MGNTSLFTGGWCNNYQLYHGFTKYWWIFEQFLGIFSVFHEPLGGWNTEKNTKKLREYHRYFLKTHGITVLSYNYLIFSHHNAFYRQLTGVKRDFFKCMYSFSSSMHNTFEVLNTDILGMKYQLVF